MSESKHKTSKQKLQTPVLDSTNTNKIILKMEWIGIGLSILAFLLYAPTLNHGFVLDDGLVTTLNSFVKKGFSGLWDIFSHSYRAGASISTESDYMYRPLSVMMFAKEWSLFPNNPKIHHFFNVLFYALTIYLIFKFLIKLLGDTYLPIIIITCLIFTVHPVHTEVVSNIKSRDEIMAMFFGIGALYILLFDNKYSILIASISFFLSLLSKEGSAIILFIAPLMLYCFNKSSILKPTLYLISSFIIWYILRNVFLGQYNYEINVNDNQLVGLTFFDRAANSMSILWHYFKLILYPYPLSWDYSFNTLPILNWKNLLPLISLIVHLSLLIYAILKLKSKNIFSFLILAYFISMALYSNLFILIGTLLGERLAYFGSLWIILAIVILAAKLLKFNFTQLLATGNIALYSLFTLIALGFSYLSFSRAADWKDNFTLFSSDVIHNPSSFRTHQALGDESLQLFMKYYKNSNDSIKYLNLAEKHHRMSSDISKNFSNQVGLGNALLNLTRYQEALQYFESAQSFTDNKVIQERIRTSCYRLGISYAKDSNNLVKAEEYLMRTYKMDSSQVELMSDLGMVYGIGKQFEKALFYFNKAYLLKPDDPTIINNLANTYFFLGNKTKSDELFKKLAK